MPLKLIHDGISRVTREAAQEILEACDSGHAQGLAFVLVLKGKRYVVNVAGSAAENPTETRGMLCALDDELQRMVQGLADNTQTL